MAPVVGRIRRRSSFRALTRPEGRATDGPLAVAYARVAEGQGMPVVAYAVGRRAGCAVERNRLRRRLRAATRSAAPDLPEGAYLVRAAPPAAQLPFADLRRALSSAARAAASRGGATTREVER